jgi:hypothetical protein
MTRTDEMKDLTLLGNQNTKYKYDYKFSEYFCQAFTVTFLKNFHFDVIKRYILCHLGFF